MPGSAAKMGYFFQKLATLRSDQKAAAVNLGMFPDSGVQVASAAGAQSTGEIRASPRRLKTG